MRSMQGIMLAIGLVMSASLMTGMLFGNHLCRHLYDHVFVAASCSALFTLEFSRFLTTDGKPFGIRGGKSGLDDVLREAVSSSTAAPAAAVASAAQDELAAIGSEIEKRLQSESGTIMQGFKDMREQLDQDMSKSGVRSLHEIEESVKEHSKTLQEQFSSMTDSLVKRMSSWMGNGSSTSSSLPTIPSQSSLTRGLQDQLETSLSSSSVPASPSASDSSSNIFSADFWKKIF